MTVALIVLLAVALAGFLALLLRTRLKSRRPKVVVLGQQLALAKEKERERLKANPAPSPFPKSSYSLMQTDLLRPAPATLDDDIRALISDFMSLPPSERDNFRRRISLNENYTLRHFAMRSAVFALRTKDAEVVRSGLAALAVIDTERIDPRDIPTAISLLYYSAKRIQLNPDREIALILDFCEPKMRERLRKFAGETADYKDITRSWGYGEAVGPDGAGFAKGWFKDYHPTTNLLQVGLDIVELIDKDKYKARSPELATDIPTVWFRPDMKAEVTEQLAHVTATISISAYLEKEYSPDANAQMFLVFLAELTSAAPATRLAEISRSKESKSFCRLALAVDNLFCLIIARSYTGVPPFEQGDSLVRFENDICDVLRRRRLSS